jgi:hypothetical protein
MPVAEVRRARDIIRENVTALLRELGHLKGLPAGQPGGSR